MPGHLAEGGRRMSPSQSAEGLRNLLKRSPQFQVRALLVRVKFILATVVQFYRRLILATVMQSYRRDRQAAVGQHHRFQVLWQNPSFHRRLGTSSTWQHPATQVDPFLLNGTRLTGDALTDLVCAVHAGGSQCTEGPKVKGHDTVGTRYISDFGRSCQGFHLRFTSGGVQAGSREDQAISFFWGHTGYGPEALVYVVGGFK